MTFQIIFSRKYDILNNLLLNLLVGEKSMPQILKVMILVNCFGTSLKCNSEFHIKLIFHVQTQKNSLKGGYQMAHTIDKLHFYI